MEMLSIYMDFLVLHLGVDVDSCCDLYTRMTEEARDVVYIFRILIQECSAGMTKLVGGEALLGGDFHCVIEGIELLVSKMVGGDMSAVLRHGDERFFI